MVAGSPSYFERISQSKKKIFNQLKNKTEVTLFKTTTDLRLDVHSRVVTGSSDGFVRSRAKLALRGLAVAQASSGLFSQ